MSLSILNFGDYATDLPWSHPLPSGLPQKPLLWKHAQSAYTEYPIPPAWRSVSSNLSTRSLSFFSFVCFFIDKLSFLTNWVPISRSFYLKVVLSLSKLLLHWLPALLILARQFSSLVFRTPFLSHSFLSLWCAMKKMHAVQVKLCLLSLLIKNHKTKARHWEEEWKQKNRKKRRQCVVTCLIRGVADGIPNGSHAWKQREERLSNRASRS